jgi:hypothetical protein
MAWFKVDDRFWGHKKIAELYRSRWYHEALSLWVLSGSWVGSALTDGFVPATMLPVFRARPRAAEALCKVGLWERADGGFRFVDWAEYQPSSQAVKQARQRTRDRTKRWREKARDEVRDAVTPAVRDADGAPSPIQFPIPEEEKKEEISSGGRSWDSPAHAYTREALPTWTADKQALCFQTAYLARRQTSPSMGGRQVGDFHRRVIETAQARGTTPERLFSEVLDRWLNRELNEREKSSPYACFANAFGDLVDREGRAMSAEIKLMQEQAAEALRVVRGGR